MSRILRLPLNAELPMTCMTCGEMATHRVVRTFRADGDSHSMKVPACAHCAAILSTYPRFQRYAGFLMAALLVVAAVLFCLDWYGLATLALFAMVPAGLHFLYYHWRFERDCLGIGKRFILLRVHSEQFVRARDESLQQEDFVDWYERLRCEGESQTQIARRMEAFGFPSREVYERMADMESRRRAFYRVHGLRRFLLGSTVALAGLVGVWFFPPCGWLCFQGLGPMLGGMGQMVTGTGYRG